MSSKITYEVCLESIASIKAAMAGGADRVELCADLLEGGITPSSGMIEIARRECTGGLQVMIRPRGGDFLYSADELAVMEADILTAKRLGADGVVFGLLNTDGTVDTENTKRFVELARPLNVTFHRAFDMSRDPFQALESLVDAGVDRILTSGQAPTVLEGIELLAQLIEKAGDRIIVMPGCGVTLRNQERIIKACNPKELHIAVNEVLESKMEYRNLDCYMGTELRSPEYQQVVTSSKAVKAMTTAGQNS